MAPLRPFVLDSVLRVGGRLEYPTCDFESKHPVILPKCHPVVDLLIRHYHEAHGHVGCNHVLSLIRKKVWIVQGLQAVKRVVGRCIDCRKWNAPLCYQQMAPLSIGRVKESQFAFENVGVDYFGPFTVKQGRSSVKRFGCLFTCLQIRAIHLEVTSDMTTDSFIMALLRFVRRRGSPTNIYSDNGTNFVGAVRELKDHISRWDQKKIAGSIAERGVQWHFNPPEASHRGGVWERIIRSVRRVLLATMKEQNSTEEVLNTVFVQAEGILNSRPLVPISSDHRDQKALTPNDLLLIKGDNLNISDSISKQYQKRWRQVVHLTSVFWHRWLRDYLPILQLRRKWFKDSSGPYEGDVVIVHQTAVPRKQWPLGVIVP